MGELIGLGLVEPRRGGLVVACAPEPGRAPTLLTRALASAAGEVDEPDLLAGRLDVTWSAVTGRLIRDRAAHREGLGLLGGGDVVVSARALQEARWLLRRSEDARPPVEALLLAYMVAIWRADRDQLSRLILALGPRLSPLWAWVDTLSLLPIAEAEAATLLWWLAGLGTPGGPPPGTARDEDEEWAATIRDRWHERMRERWGRDWIERLGEGRPPGAGPA